MSTHDRKEFNCRDCEKIIKRFDCEIEKMPRCRSCSRKINVCGKPFVKNHIINLGRKHSKEFGEKISRSKKGMKAVGGFFKKGHKKMGDCGNKKGFRHTEESILKMRLSARKGENHPLSQWAKEHGGKLHPKWIEDRTKLKRYNDSSKDRRSYAYKDWRLQVYKRDDYKCKINNLDCSGRIIAHHILPWINYPELRYEINNGITLCQAHHPRKRAEEKRLIPVFQELVPVSNLNICL